MTRGDVQWCLPLIVNSGSCGCLGQSASVTLALYTSCRCSLGLETRPILLGFFIFSRVIHEHGRLLLLGNTWSCGCQIKIHINTRNQHFPVNNTVKMCMFVHSSTFFHLSFSFYVFECGRKPTQTGRTFKLHTERPQPDGGFKPRSFLLWGNHAIALLCVQNVVILFNCPLV